MRIQLAILTLIPLNSCQSEIKVKFKITNLTSNNIDSISVNSFDHKRNSNFIKLESGKSQTYQLDMTELHKVDGDYLLTFKKNHLNKKTIEFGY